MYTLEEKLQIIERAKNFDELKNCDILPEPCFDDGYYFVSYSHRDYKRVIPEILSLQEHGVKIWYDRGLETGISWFKDVCRKISSFRCKGVIVYASESFCASVSCAREIEQIGESNKSSLLVQLEPCFPDGLLPNAMLPYECSLEEKVSALYALPKPELYEFQISSIKGVGKCAVLCKVNDPNIQRVEIPAYANIGAKRYPVRVIGDGALSYCYNLCEVTIPDGWAIISHGAFANCYFLQRVVFGHPFRMRKGLLRVPSGYVSHSFMNCTALSSVEFPSKRYRNEEISFSNAFMGCTALKTVTVDSSLTFIADEKICCLEQAFPYAEIFYIKNGASFQLSEHFCKVTSDRIGYEMYRRTL